MADEEPSQHEAQVESEPLGRPSELGAFAELFALSGLVVAKPILGTFGSNADALVTARAGWLDITAFVAIVCLGLPAVLWLMEKAVGSVSRRARTWFHRCALGGLAAIFVLPQLRNAESFAFVLVLLALVAVVTVVAVRRPAPARQFLRYLAIGPAVFLLLFVVSPAGRLLFAGDPQSAGDLGTDDLPPVVMIVLDELPLSSLLDGNGAIDSDAFPALAELAQNATFARNHTTVAPDTPDAVPAILTGTLPSDSSALATASDHPRSLFTLLGSQYRIRASEHVTHLCPDSLCEEPDAEGTMRQGPLRALLPAAMQVILDKPVSFDIGIEGVDPEARFDWLADGFDDADGRPTLHYLHTMLPHQNWVRLPDGRFHDAPAVADGMVDGVIPEDPAAAQLAKQRHMLQLSFADELVGRTLDSLREAGLYDDALIVVTSDHGVSFNPGEPARGVSEPGESDILWTPLLIKTPHQNEPQVVDSPTSSIDVLPTIVDVLGIDIDWKFDGQSIFGKARPDDWERLCFPWHYNKLEPSADGFVHVDGVAGYAENIKSRGLDAGPGSDLRLYRWGEFGDLVGRPVSSFERGPTDGATTTIDDSEKFDSVDLSAKTVPSYVSGSVIGDGPEVVVVTVNDVVGGWYDTSESEGPDGARSFHVLVPPSLLVDGQNKVDAYLIGKKGDEVVLVASDSSR